MKHLWILSILFIIAGASSCSAPKTLAVCPTDLTPISIQPPKLPAELHNEFIGTIHISLIVDRFGHVQSPIVTSAEWHPVGRSRGQPSGYNDAIISAVTHWRYPAQKHSCKHKVAIELQQDDLRGAPAVRSNNSFKPTPLRGAA
jgi:hypothetical protein